MRSEFYKKGREVFETPSLPKRWWVSLIRRYVHQWR